MILDIILFIILFIDIPLSLTLLFHEYKFFFWILFLTGIPVLEFLYRNLMESHKIKNTPHWIRILVFIVITLPFGIIYDYYKHDSMYKWLSLFYYLNSILFLLRFLGMTLSLKKERAS